MLVIAYRAHSSTSNIERVFLYKDSGATAGTEGDPITGLDHNESGLSISSIANNAATAVTDTVAGTDDIEDITTLGTYAAPTAGKVRFKEVDSTAHPGLYEIQFLDTVYSVTDSKYTDICITGVADLATFHGRIYLDVIDAAAIDQVLQDYDSSAGVVSNTDHAARSIEQANIPTKTDVSDVSTTVTTDGATTRADVLETAQVFARNDADNATANTAKTAEINEDHGAGAGTFDPTTDSLEAGVTKIDGKDLDENGTGGQKIGAA